MNAAHALTPPLTQALPRAANDPGIAPDLRERQVRITRRGITIVAAWLLLFGAWATWAPISGGVVASGLVKVEADRRSVSHRDGGTVSAIRVKEGQTVRQGDVLVELDDVRVEASVGLLRAQLAADRLRQSRLEAEAARTDRWSAPPALGQEFADVARFGEQAAKERATFDARRSHVQAQIDGERRQADDTRTEIGVRLRERENARQAMALMQEELALNQKLQQENYVNRTRVMSLQRAVSEYESRQLNNEAELAQAQQRLGALESRMRAVRDALVQAAAEELREVGARVSDAEQRLRASNDDRARQKIVAPESGRIVNLRVNTVGSAIGPREPVVDIVPANAPLQIELRLAPDAAADVTSGTAAEVRPLTAQSRYNKLLAATVTQVSADSLEDQRSGAAYVNVRVQVDASALPPGAPPLQPGMAAEVYIKVAERTPLGFLIEPVAAYFRRGFRAH
jgi:HlyD family type I secretion membrane fusion protein